MGSPDAAEDPPREGGEAVHREESSGGRERAEESIPRPGRTDGTERGDRGEPGRDGAEGPAGADGADGLSAYQLWLKAVHSGSKAAYQKWLKGKRGERGRMGPGGSDGSRGAPGPPGAGSEPVSTSLTRDGNGNVQSVSIAGGATWTISRNPDGSAASITDGETDVAVDRDQGGTITGTTVEP